MPARHLSLEEISDRIQIGDLLTRYTTAIDTKDYELLDSVFTPDARVDYTSSGGIAGDYPTARDWLERALSLFPVTVHFISNSTVELRGDEASARTYVMSDHIFTVGAYYNDRLVRTEDGWRIRERIEEQAYLDGSLPKVLQIPS
jgi:hypothetical protein